MKKEKLLTISVVILLLLNLGTLGFLFLSGPPPHFWHSRHEPTDKLIVTVLNLTDVQEAQFEKMRQEHHEAMIALDEENRHLVKQYFDLINAANSDTLLKDSLGKQIGVNHVKKASITFNHFEQLKMICTPEQKKRFEALLPKLIFLLITPPKGARPFREH